MANSLPAPAPSTPVTGLVIDERYQQHDTGPGHPERPERISAIQRKLEQTGLLNQVRRIPPRPATVEELHRVHAKSYIDQLTRAYADGKRALTPDTPMGTNTESIARLAAGGVLAAVDAVVTGELRNAYCVVRPPGHHASANRGMGFCFYNNVAVAARHAQKTHGLKKVLIVDWDVHHGNGTQEIFDADPSVFFFSVHQSPFYPGTGLAGDTGQGDAKGTKLNVPLPAGCGDTEFVQALREKLVPAADKFQPDLVLISCGLDAHVNDLLGGMQVTDAGYAKMTEIVCAIADRHAKGRVVSVLEGGYNLDEIAQASVAHLRALIRAASQPTAK